MKHNRYNLYNTISKPSNIPGRVVVVRTHTILKVSSPFSAILPSKARMLGGYYNTTLHEWIYPRSQEPKVQQLYTATFGAWDTIPEGGK